MKPGIRALTLLLSSGLAVTASAEVYRWTDASGAVHFSDTPPDTGQPARVELREPVTVPMADNIGQAERVGKSRKAVGRMLAPSGEDRYRQEKQQAQARAARCRKLKQRLERIQAQLRRGHSNERGNRLREQKREVGDQYSRECILN